jgi:hypothetical protein
VAAVLLRVFVADETRGIATATAVIIHYTDLSETTSHRAHWLLENWTCSPIPHHASNVLDTCV